MLFSRNVPKRLRGAFFMSAFAWQPSWQPIVVDTGRRCIKVDICRKHSYRICQWMKQMLSLHGNYEMLTFNGKMSLHQPSHAICQHPPLFWSKSLQIFEQLTLKYLSDYRVLFTCVTQIARIISSTHHHIHWIKTEVMTSITNSMPDLSTAFRLPVELKHWTALAMEIKLSAVLRWAFPNASNQFNRKNRFISVEIALRPQQ